MSVPTPSMFTTLGVTPILGRLPVIEDGQGVAVISHAAWLDWFGGDPSVIGRSYEVMSEPKTVIGVMGPEFGFPSDGVLVWVPNDIRNEDLTPGRFGVSLVGRLAPGVEMETLVERLQTVASRFPEKYGGSANYARIMEQHRPVVRPLEQELVGFVAAPLKVLLGAVLMVLLIACANVTNLFLVRAERRQRDLAVRRAIGAGWAQLVRPSDWGQMRFLDVPTVRCKSTTRTRWTFRRISPAPTHHLGRPKQSDTQLREPSAR